MAAASKGSAHVKGYRETMRALNKMEKDTAKAVKDGLKKAAEPVAAAARANVSVYEGASTGTIGPRVTTKGVFVTQRARKVTGLRGDFGSLQMTKGLIPALEDNETQTVETVEDAFWRLARTAGF